MGRNGKITDVNEIAEYLFEQFQSSACEKNPVTVKRVTKHFKITPRQLGRMIKAFFKYFSAGDTFQVIHS